MTDPTNPFAPRNWPLGTFDTEASRVARAIDRIADKAREDPLCPWCGAYSPRSCDMAEEMGVCPWEEAQPDPDILREDRDERRRLEKEEPGHD